MRARRAVPARASLAPLALAVFVAPAVLGLTAPLVGQGRVGPAIFISADMEGLAGVVTSEQLGPSGFEYQRFREFMTREVLAAIEGARRGGAGRILVADSHGNGQNLLIEQFPDDIQIVRSWPRPLGMMQGVDSTFAGVIFIGYHSATTNPDGVRAHTFSSATLAEVRLNGVPIAESGMNAAIAGHFGVPVLMVSGDEAAVAEVRDRLGDVEEAVVKWSVSFHSAQTLTPAAAQQLIAERAERAVRRLTTFRPQSISTPVTLDVRFKSYRPGQLLAFLPSVERVDAHTIRFVGRDILEVSRFMQVLTGYSATLEP
jgi:D-amino peptidase